MRSNRIDGYTLVAPRPSDPSERTSTRPSRVRASMRAARAADAARAQPDRSNGASLQPSRDGATSRLSILSSRRAPMPTLVGGKRLPLHTPEKLSRPLRQVADGGLHRLDVLGVPDGLPIQQ